MYETQGHFQCSPNSLNIKHKKATKIIQITFNKSEIRENKYIEAKVEMIFSFFILLSYPFLIVIHHNVERHRYIQYMILTVNERKIIPKEKINNIRMRPFSCLISR